jgi:hypothetical protein
MGCGGGIKKVYFKMGRKFIPTTKDAEWKLLL